MATTTIPPRMHLPYARRVGRRGYPIRRVGWTDKWLRWQEGKWWYQSGATLRVLQAADLTEEDWLAWDWTTLQVGCDGVNDAADLAELLRIRPYDVLTTAVDPLSLRCELPPLASTMEPQAWKDVDMPPVDERARPQLVRPDEPIPWPPRPAEPEWLPGRRRNRPVADGGGGTPATPVVAFGAVSAVQTWGACIPTGISPTYHIGSMVLRMVNGVAGRAYAMTLKGPNGTIPDATLWTGTLEPGQAHTYGPGPTRSITPGFLGRHTYILEARDGGVLVASATWVLQCPDYCSVGS